MNETLRSKAAKKVTFVGAGANLFLAIFKVLFGILGNSSALVADGVHSFSDLLTDGLVILASHFGSRKADHDHPYGHQRIETAATLFLALLLILTGAAIAYDALSHLFVGKHHAPRDYVLVVVIISIVVNEVLFHYTHIVGKKIQSNLIIANAWHHRSDAFSSLVVLIGVIGALLGYAYWDSIAAVIVGIMIIKMGAGLGWSSVRELVDTGVDLETLEKIRSTIMSVPGVMELHQLRTRCMADAILVDAHILVQPKLTVSEGHYISVKAHQALLENFDKISDVTIHIDPENDEIHPVNLNLPPRTEITAEIMSHLSGKPCVDAIADIRLHYLAETLHVEFIMPMEALEDGVPAEELKAIYEEALKPIRCISNLQLLFV